MAKTIRACPTVQLQPECTEEPQTNTIVPQQEGQGDISEGKVLADHELDVDYEPEGSDSENEPIAPREEECKNGAISTGNTMPKVYEL